MQSDTIFKVIAYWYDAAIVIEKPYNETKLDKIRL
jgi:hypothetical protein